MPSGRHPHQSNVFEAVCCSKTSPFPSESMRILYDHIFKVKKNVRLFLYFAQKHLNAIIEPQKYLQN